MLILASASPRRQELLRNADIEFVVHPTDIPEVPRSGEAPRDCAERLAFEKAAALAPQYPGRFILGADTIVVVSGEMLGKPADRADAERMLRLLSGRSHAVITGVCLIGPGIKDVSSEITMVEFSELNHQEVAFYASTGEPMDKAGGYAIQGIASRWIRRIEGDYSNVVGLPVALVYRLLCKREVLP